MTILAVFLTKRAGFSDSGTCECTKWTVAVPVLPIFNLLLGIPGMPVVWQEELVKQAVDLQQAGAVDGDFFCRDRGEALVLKPSQLGVEAF